MTSASIAEWRASASLPFRWALLTAMVLVIACAIVLIGLLSRLGDARIWNSVAWVVGRAMGIYRRLAHFVFEREDAC